MIIAKEFRIGNLIEVRIDYSTWIQQVIDIHLLSDIIESREPETFRYIHITEQWLEEFGFEVTEPFGSIKHPEFRKSLRWIKRRNLMSDEIIEKPYLRFDPDVDIHFVHQLQNLIFALTGLELERETK